MFVTVLIVHILPLFLTIRLVVCGAKCGVLPSDLIDCARKHGVDRIPSDSVGYGFGFGSIDAVENMCRTKWHLKVYTCAHQTVLSRCAKEKNSQFRERMWQFMFDTTRYARAALYLCKSHNLKLFRMHQSACFIPLESSVEMCSRKYAQTLSTTTSRLATNSPTNMTNEASYADYMQREITQAYCFGTIEKITCVSQVLQQLCSVDAIALIRNYYRETLPENCARASDLTANRGRVYPTKRATETELGLLKLAPLQRDKTKLSRNSNQPQLTRITSSRGASMARKFRSHHRVWLPGLTFTNNHVVQYFICILFLFQYFV